MVMQKKQKHSLTELIRIFEGMSSIPDSTMEALKIIEKNPAAKKDNNLIASVIFEVAVITGQKILSLSS